MLKELLPIMTEEERQQHAVLAKKGHLNNNSMKVFQILDQKKRESVLSNEERHVYDEIRLLENPSDLQKQELITICNKAGIEIPMNLNRYSKILSTSLTSEEEHRLAELTAKAYLDTNEDIEFGELSNKLPKERPMWFHKWIYFSLILGALFLVSNGVIFISGDRYSAEGFSPDRVYSVFPTLKSIDMLFGILYFALAIGSVYTCRRLAQLKQNGPMSLKTLVIIAMLMNIAYPMLSFSALKIPISMSVGADQLGTLLASAIYLLIIWIYYDKRKSMFIN